MKSLLNIYPLQEGEVKLNKMLKNQDKLLTILISTMKIIKREWEKIIKATKGTRMAHAKLRCRKRKDCILLKDILHNLNT